MIKLHFSDMCYDFNKLCITGSMSLHGTDSMMSRDNQISHEFIPLGITLCVSIFRVPAVTYTHICEDCASLHGTSLCNIGNGSTQSSVMLHVSQFTLLHI